MDVRLIALIDIVRTLDCKIRELIVWIEQRSNASISLRESSKYF